MLIETKVDGESAAPAKGRRGSVKPWHAVTIAARTDACAAAQACKGKRFLSKDAPRLPLENCDAARCECKYRHFDDRRGSARREKEKGAPPKMGAQGAQHDRRHRRGRRQTD